MILAQFLASESAELGKGFIAMVLYPSIFLLVVPFAGNSFKAVLDFSNHSRLDGFLMQAGVNALQQKVFGFVAPFSGFSQGNKWVGAEGSVFCFPSKR